VEEEKAATQQTCQPCEPYVTPCSNGGRPTNPYLSYKVVKKKAYAGCEDKDSGCREIKGDKAYESKREIITSKAARCDCDVHVMSEMNREKRTSGVGL
jgi:hypothetical protein